MQSSLVRFYRYQVFLYVIRLSELMHNAYDQYSASRCPCQRHALQVSNHFRDSRWILFRDRELGWMAILSQLLMQMLVTAAM